MFKSMANFKLPSFTDMKQEREAQERFGDKKIVVITGTSSGLGRETALALLQTGKYHVIGAVRDMDKMEAVAEVEEFDMDNFSPMEVELNSFESVRKFCKDLQKFLLGRPLDRLICNAGIYQPSLPYAKWSVDGHEQTMQVNYLSHFLMISLLLPDLTKAGDARVTIVGSVTGNDNTVGGGGVYPVADLYELDGFKAGAKNPVSMVDGYNFDGAKAYKDSKLCLMMLANTLYDMYAKQTGIAFSSIYPGCMAESPLFREKREWFRRFFPIFMKYITGGFVSEREAGQRLFQVTHDPRCSKSGVYWGWNGGPREGRGELALERDGQISGSGGAGGGWDSIFENDQSDKVLDREKAFELFKLSTVITGAEWPPANQPKSPCPTLKVIGTLTKLSHAKEEAKRKKPMEGNVAGLGVRLAGGTAKVADAVVGNTVGRVAGIVGSRVLGQMPDTALEGSFQEEVKEVQPKAKRGLFRRIRRFGRGSPKEEPEEVPLGIAQPVGLDAPKPELAAEDDLDEELMEHEEVPLGIARPVGLAAPKPELAAEDNLDEKLEKLFEPTGMQVPSERGMTAV